MRQPEEVTRGWCRARDFAARHGIAGWSGDLGTALQQARADGGRLDLAPICTPPGSHVPLAVQCLQAAVPVLLETPPALSLAQADEPIAVSERTGVDVAVVFQHRFRLWRRARALLATAHRPPRAWDGRLSHALVPRCRLLRGARALPRSPTWRRLQAWSP